MTILRQVNSDVSRVKSSFPRKGRDLNWVAKISDYAINGHTRYRLLKILTALRSMQL